MVETTRLAFLSSGTRWAGWLTLPPGTGRIRRSSWPRFRGRSHDGAADLSAAPGRWITHCHNTYHLEAGMGTVIFHS
jgi:hypothetical protein